MRYSEEKKEWEAEYEDLTEDEKKVVDYGDFYEQIKTWYKADKRIKKKLKK